MFKEVHEQTEKHEDEMQLYANNLTRELWKRVLGTKKPFPSAQDGDNTNSAIGASTVRNGRRECSPGQDAADTSLAIN